MLMRLVPNAVCLDKKLAERYAFSPLRTFSEKSVRMSLLIQGYRRCWTLEGLWRSSKRSEWVHSDIGSDSDIVLFPPASRTAKLNDTTGFPALVGHQYVHDCGVPLRD